MNQVGAGRNGTVRDTPPAAVVHRRFCVKQATMLVRPCLTHEHGKPTTHRSLAGLTKLVRPRRAGHAVHAYMSTPSIMARRQATATPCLLGAGTCHEFHVALLGCSPRWARLTRRSVIMAWDLHAGERGVSSQARERVPVRVHGRGRERERE